MEISGVTSSCECTVTAGSLAFDDRGFCSVPLSLRPEGDSDGQVVFFGTPSGRSKEERLFSLRYRADDSMELQCMAIRLEGAEGLEQITFRCFFESVDSRAMEG